MEKEMLAIGKFKEEEDRLEIFMKFFQSDEHLDHIKLYELTEVNIEN